MIVKFEMKKKKEDRCERVRNWDENKKKKKKGIDMGEREEINEKK